MTKILEHLPIVANRGSVRFGDRHVTVHRNQILLWVSIHLIGAAEPESTIPKIPALLDTGNNFEFSIQHRHLREWAGIDAALLTPLGNVEINEQVVNCHEAAVWLYPN